MSLRRGLDVLPTAFVSFQNLKYIVSKVNNKEIKNANFIPFYVTEMCWTVLDEYS